MKVSELSGAQLNYWVAKGLNLLDGIDAFWSDARSEYIFQAGPQHFASIPHYCSDWIAGGPLIESNQVFLDPPHSKHVSGGPFSGWHTENDWTATVSARVRTYREPGDEGWVKDQGRVGRGAGATPLIAAMRAIVTSVYGREVPDA